MPKESHEHELLEVDSHIVLAVGLGGAGRQFPDYYAKFGEENVTCVLWDKTCTDLEAHIVYL
ncbi:MAG: hypothetical protein ACTSSH_09875, partial [Candidatus Heimdallarchaeota archaeon]